MSNPNKQEAERAAFLAWWKKRVPAGSDSDHAAVFAYEVWQASRRAVAADTGVEDSCGTALPPLPRAAMLVGGNLDSLQTYYTVEQVRQAQREAHTAGLAAGYALAQEEINNLRAKET